MHAITMQWATDEGTAPVRGMNKHTTLGTNDHTSDTIEFDSYMIPTSLLNHRLTETVVI